MINGNKQRIFACIDKESLRNSALIGLQGENIAEQRWLICASDAEEFRELLRGESALADAWVMSSDTMDGINIAAAIKHDNPDRRVVLIGNKETGSIATRAQHAHVSNLWSQQRFVKEYFQAKIAYASQEKKDTSVRDEKHESSHDSKGLVHVRRNTSGAEGKIVSLLSSAGGVGKSTLAAALSQSARTRGLRVALLDADIQFGDCAWLSGVDASVFEFESEENLKSLSMQINNANPEFAVIGCAQRPELAEVFYENISEFLGNLQALFDLVVVNTGSFWTELHAHLIEKSDTVLFVLEQRSASIRSTLQAMDLCARMGLATHDFMFVINKYLKRRAISSQDIQQTLRGAQVFVCADGGQDVENLMASGRSCEVASLKNPFVVDVEHLASSLFDSGLNASAHSLNRTFSKELIIPQEDKKPFFFFGRKRVHHELTR